MKRFSVIFYLLPVLVLILALFCASAFAGGLRTENSDVPDEDDLNPNALTLTGSSTPNGARNVPLNPVIQLNFNKNVVNFVVAGDNALSYHLVDDNQNSVPIRIIVPDDQMQQAVKRNVFIIPEENLLPNTIYTLAVDNTLTAKNGDRIDDAHTIVFKTGAQLESKTNPLLASLGNDILTFSNDLPLNENSVPGASPTSSALNRPAGNSRLLLKDINTELFSHITLITAIFVLIFITVFTLRGKKQS